MATEKNQPVSTEKEALVESQSDRVHQFWSKYSKQILAGLGVVAVLVVGYFGYETFIVKPAETAANEAIWKAEANFKIDSFQLALNGDGTKLNPGFLKVISKHSGTKSANTAHFYAGVCYLQLGDFKNAVKYLEDFSTTDNELLMRTHGCLADAYSEMGNTEKAIAHYKEAATTFESDEYNSSEYLFRLAQLYDKNGKKKEAVEAFSDLKTKFPNTMRANEVDKYLARLGVTN
jgi:tetratricopeptide (TPR) repeat protein